MNIIIPMAGWGTRLRPHTLTVPKPLIKVAGKPVVQRLVETIAASVEAPVENVVFVIKPAFGPEIEQKLLDLAAALGMKGHIRYQEQALGTAHAIYMAAEFLEGNTFVAYADTLFDGRIEIDPEADSMIVVKKVDRPEQFGVVQLDEYGYIKQFVEKPKEFVSDLAIVGIYYFRDGAVLRNEIQYLMDNGIMKSGEYQLTDALENMLRKGMKFKPAGIDRWMDFGNYKAAVATNRDVLEIAAHKGENTVSDKAVLENARIIPPCYVEEGVVVRNATVGPYVSLHAGTRVEGGRIEESLIGENNLLENSLLKGSMIGSHTHVKDFEGELSLGDYSKILRK